MTLSMKESKNVKFTAVFECVSGISKELPSVEENELNSAESDLEVI